MKIGKAYLAVIRVSTSRGRKVERSNVSVQCLDCPAPVPVEGE